MPFMRVVMPLMGAKGEAQLFGLTLLDYCCYCSEGYDFLTSMQIIPWHWKLNESSVLASWKRTGHFFTVEKKCK